MTTPSVSALTARYGEDTPPRWPLGDWPTPLDRVEVAGVELWVKREGVATPQYGGNKVRKLEWILGELTARPRPPVCVVTAGAAGSHHVAATARFAARAGIATHALLAPQAHSADAADHLRLSHHTCTHLTAVAGTRDLPALAAAMVARMGPSAAWIPIGGSSPAGVLGAVDLGIEIAHQVRDGAAPRPARILAPLGSGGTAAGLSLGLVLGGLHVAVEAVRVSPPPFARRRRLARLMRGAAALLPDGPAAVALALDQLRVRHDQVGPGYARPWARAAAAMAAGQAAGVATEATYSARALAAALDGAPGPTLFVATANARPLDPLLRDAPPLPAGLLALLEAA